MKISKSILSLICFMLVLHSDVLAQRSPFGSAHGPFLKLLRPQAVPFEVGYQFAPSKEPDEDGGSEAEFDELIIDTHLFHFMDMDRDLALAPGLSYSARMLDFDNKRPSLGDDSETLHHLSGHFGGMYFSDDDLMWNGEITVGAYGNLDGGVSSDDIQVLGSLMAVLQRAPDFLWVLGAGVTEDFDSTTVIPLLGLRSATGPWHFNLTLPVNAVATYNAGNGLSFYGGGWLSGKQYRVEGADDQEFDIQVRDQRIGLGLYYWLNKMYRITLEGGILAGGDAFEFKIDDTGEKYEGDLENSGYIRSALGVRF